jgi:tyrosinase
MNGELIIRKNIRSLSASEIQSFIQAIKALKAKVDDNSISKYDQYVLWHSRAMNTMVDGVRNLAHSGPIFLPWHREYLRRFEKDLQEAVPGVTLPYWDWTEDSNNPESSPIWSEDFLGGNGDPTYTHPSLDFTPTAQTGFVVRTGPFRYDPDDSDRMNWDVLFCDDDGNPVSDQNGNLRRDPLLRWFVLGSPNFPFPTPADVESVKRIIPYDSHDWFEHEDDENPSFRNVLEGWKPFGVHNAIHVWIGGTMQFAVSPGDPAFFLNHCNIDRLWAEYQAQLPTNPQRDYPSDGTVTRPDGTLIMGNNRSDKMFPWNNEAGGYPTLESVLNHRALGYRYDTENP